MEPQAIARELTVSTQIAEFRGLQIHLLDGPECPSTLAEIGRIREQEYRRVGAGRGAERDIDRFDLKWPWYRQLVSWDPQNSEVVAAYRAIRCDWALTHGGTAALRTSELFEFDDRFISDYLTDAVELGRSVVNAQARKAVSGLFSVWVGLGALVREWPQIRYFFGNVSLYRSLPQPVSWAIVAYLLHHHRRPELLVQARQPLEWVRDILALRRSDTSVPQSFDALQTAVASAGGTVPPILVSYAKAHSAMLAFDVAEDGDFGSAFEIAIAIPVEGLSERTVERFITPYTSTNPRRFDLPDAPPRRRIA